MVSTGREGAEAFMRKWHDAESYGAAERHVKTTAAPPIGDTNTRWGGVGECEGRRGERGVGSVLPKKLRLGLP